MTKSTPNTDLFTRETRAILFCAIVFCLSTVFFIGQKEYFNACERPLEVAYTADTMRLARLESEGRKWVSENPICQYNGYTRLDSVTIRGLEARMTIDSIVPMYILLSAKGWKIESSWWLQQRYLNPDLIQRMRKCLDHSAIARYNSKASQQALLAYRLYREQAKTRCTDGVSFLFCLMTIIVFPVRWGWYYWKTGYNIFNDIHHHLSSELD